MKEISSMKSSRDPVCILGQTETDTKKATPEKIEAAIEMIRELNPNVQIILTTHSPAVIMEGWLDAVTEVSDIATSYK